MGGGGGGKRPRNASSSFGGGGPLKRPRTSRAFYNVRAGSGGALAPALAGAACELRVSPLPRDWSAYELDEWLAGALAACPPMEGGERVAHVLCRTADRMDHGYATFVSAAMARCAAKHLRRCGNVGKLGGGDPRLDVSVYMQGIALNLRHVALFGRNASEPDAAGEGEAAAAAAAPVFTPRDPRDVVAPLWRWPYANQLAAKFHTFATAMHRLAEVMDKLGHAEQPRPPHTDVASVREHSNKRFPCPCYGIVRSPRLNDYRNKCEFTVGYDAEFRPACGFQGGRFADGFTTVTRASNVPLASPTARAFADALTDFLRLDSAHGGSVLPLRFRVWDKTQSCGFWRNLVVREAGMSADLEATEHSWKSYLVPPGELPAERADAGKEPGPAANGGSAEVAASAGGGPTFGPVKPSAVMLVLVVSPAAALACVRAQGLARSGSEREACRALVTREVERLVAHLDGVSRADVISVLYHDGCSNHLPPEARMEVVRSPAAGAASDAATPPRDEERMSDAFARAVPGHGTLDETLLNLKFRISPLAFFQVNTAAASLLYRAAGDLASAGGAADTDRTRTLFDVCCGTGTIGLTLFPSPFPKVVGVELEASAVRDAWENARRNFGDDALRDDAVKFVAAKAEDALPGLLRASSGSAVAIVDPPRAGLHRKVLDALVSNRGIAHLVYVSCNVESLVENAARLCSGPCGFSPTSCLALDLFPHTVHVEAVVRFDRRVSP